MPEDLINQRDLSFLVSIPAAISDVWQAWTTREGAKTFFAPDCKIDLKPGGAYEMYFNLEAPKGEEGARV